MKQSLKILKSRYEAISVNSKSIAMILRSVILFVITFKFSRPLQKNIATVESTIAISYWRGERNMNENNCLVEISLCRLGLVFGHVVL